MKIVNSSRQVLIETTEGLNSKVWELFIGSSVEIVLLSLMRFSSKQPTSKSHYNECRNLWLSWLQLIKGSSTYHCVIMSTHNSRRITPPSRIWGGACGHAIITLFRFSAVFWQWNGLKIPWDVLLLKTAPVLSPLTFLIASFVVVGLEKK